MSGPFGSDQWMYSSGGYEINQSAMLYENSYYQRTPSSASNRKTWTWSGWVKRGNLNGTRNVLFNSDQNGTASNFTMFHIETDNTFRMLHYVSGAKQLDRRSLQLFRDTSAWYHIVVAFDMTQATATDRQRVYVNGEEITSWTNTTTLAQNSDTWVNYTYPHYIGLEDYLNHYLDGYLAEIHFVDGQALDASYFGETDANYGHWKPIKYAGTYGTNGYYLDFATQATDPIDASGNGNNWGSVNVVATDWKLDSPTNNFATMNPLDKNSVEVLSEGNLKQVQSSTDQWDSARSTQFVSSGKWYWEAELSDTGSPDYFVMFGVADNSYDVISNSSNTFVGSFANSWSLYLRNGTKYETATSGVAYGSSFGTGNIVMVALDMDNGKIWWGRNGTWYDSGDPAAGTNAAFTNLSGYTLSPAASVYRSNSDIVWNFGQDSSFAGNKTAQGNTDANGIGDFYYAPPSGYLALCTQNLPAPTVAPADHFNTVIWTGAGNTDPSITGVGFQPDFVWAKIRSQAYSHVLYDVLRGTGNAAELVSNSTNAEGGGNNESYDYLSSFDSDGFSTTWSGSNFAAYFDKNGESYVAWNWKANGTGVTNTDGTITSTVSANVDAGFSIVSYTGNGSTGQVDSVGHGLSQAPEIYFTKSRTTAQDWYTFSNATGSWQYGFLNGTSAFASTAQYADATEFYLSGTSTNASGDDFIAYCFHSVDGFSKIGSYTGNANADGPFVYTGFRPAFVLVKSTQSTNQWYIYDTKRDSYNPEQSLLIPNSSGAEFAWQHVDFLSNGFKIKSNNWDWNYPGKILFLAFAENPFKYANAR